MLSSLRLCIAKLVKKNGITAWYSYANSPAILSCRSRSILCANKGTQS